MLMMQFMCVCVTKILAIREPYVLINLVDYSPKYRVEYGPNLGYKMSV